jgi:hypothetical protein
LDGEREWPGRRRAARSGDRPDHGGSGTFPAHGTHGATCWPLLFEHVPLGDGLFTRRVRVGVARLSVSSRPSMGSRSVKVRESFPIPPRQRLRTVPTTGLVRRSRTGRDRGKL